MTLSVVKTLPILRGTLASLASWQALLGRSNLRVYPFQLGAKVRVAGSVNPIDTSGMGEVLASDYLIACTQTAYGNSSLYIPNMNKITRVTSRGTTDDELNVSPVPSVALGDYFLNIGADSAVAPLTAPNFDGSLIAIYDDNTGQIAHATKYLLTGSNGQFEGWLSSATLAVDLLITDTSNNPIVVIPFVSPGREIV
jgi:hypothetical protein